MNISKIILSVAFAAIATFSAEVIKVGATPEPHASILNLVKDDLAKAGYELKVVEFTDYVTPNDPTNEGRALLLLQAAGLIKLDPKSGITATPIDITENPKKLKFKELEAASLPRILQDVDAAAINGNYAIPAGLNASSHGLFVENASSPYVNVIAVKAGNEKSAKIQALVNALKSEKVKNWIKGKYTKGEVVPVF
jgi:YaeC family lipoprotein